MILDSNKIRLVDTINSIPISSASTVSCAPIEVDKRQIGGGQQLDVNIAFDLEIVKEKENTIIFVLNVLNFVPIRKIQIILTISTLLLYSKTINPNLSNYFNNIKIKNKIALKGNNTAFNHFHILTNEIIN